MLAAVSALVSSEEAATSVVMIATAIRNARADVMMSLQMVCLEFHGVEITMSMTYQAWELCWPANIGLHRVACPLPDVARQVARRAARRDHHRPGGGRGLDRTRRGGGREAHQGAGSARGEAAGHHP